MKYFYGLAMGSLMAMAWWQGYETVVIFWLFVYLICLNKLDE